MGPAREKSIAIETVLLLAVPLVPNVQRLLDREGPALGIARATPFEAYETSITLPHRHGVLRFGLSDRPLSATLAGGLAVPEHGVHLSVQGSWQRMSADVASAKQARVMCELLDQAGGDATVLWGGMLFAAEAFAAAEAAGTLPVASGRQQQPGAEAGGRQPAGPRKPGWLGRLLGR